MSAEFLAEEGGISLVVSGGAPLPESASVLITTSFSGGLVSQAVFPLSLDAQGKFEGRLPPIEGRRFLAGVYEVTATIDAGDQPAPLQDLVPVPLVARTRVRCGTHEEERRDWQEFLAYVRRLLATIERLAKEMSAQAEEWAADGGDPSRPRYSPQAWARKLAEYRSQIAALSAGHDEYQRKYLVTYWPELMQTSVREVLFRVEDLRRYYGERTFKARNSPVPADLSLPGEGYDADVLKGMLSPPLKVIADALAAAKKSVSATGDSLTLDPEELPEGLVVATLPAPVAPGSPGNPADVPRTKVWTVTRQAEFFQGIGPQNVNSVWYLRLCGSAVPPDGADWIDVYVFEFLSKQLCALERGKLAARFQGKGRSAGGMWPRGKSLVLVTPHGKPSAESVERMVDFYERRLRELDERNKPKEAPPAGAGDGQPPAGSAPGETPGEK
ncbi:MAG: hypothetical protein HYZ53_17850 [Planctomycetes bacterium]|nr:hypothetical protein [Planctomycetota bacterium]